MFLKNIALSLGLFFTLHANAQDSNCCHQKKMTHVVGVQANQLIRQIFNFSNNNPTINNPYLLTYSALHIKSKWGFDVGLGYTYNNIFDNDGNTKKESNINELYARIGVQKLIPLTRKFSSQFSFHILCELLDNKTSSVQEFNFQKTTINTNNNAFRYGVGPALSLRYKINNRVFVGTETNYYFKTGNTKSNVTTLTEFQGQSAQYQSTKTDNTMTTFLLNAPTAIFLQIRL